MLTDKQITKFQEIWKKELGEDISRERALEEGTQLVNLIKLIYKPITKKQFEELEKRRKEIGIK